MLYHLFGFIKKFARPNRGRQARPSLRPQVEALETRWVPSTSYLATDLVSDEPGVAPITDPKLVNAWGIALSPITIWVSSEVVGISTVYTGDTPGVPIAKSTLEVTVPGGSPTGQVFNGSSDFVVTSGGVSGAARFIFASESGSVTGWSPTVPAPGSTAAFLGFQALDGANYKGIALANNGTANFLYVADFRNGKIDVLNATYQKVTLAGNFVDPTLPAGYAPFNIAALSGKLYVSYALQDAARTDDVAGAGNGFVSVFNLNGTFDRRLISNGALNSPWGMVIAPATGFGDFSGALLVGNFGDGKINAFNATTGVQLGTLSQSPGRPLVIDGLWGLHFGNGTAGTTTSLYYAAGPDNETHGLFGKITANPEGTNPVTAVLTNGNLNITGSRDNDFVIVNLVQNKQTIKVHAGGEVIGTFAASSVMSIEFHGFSGHDVFVVHPLITAPTLADGGADNDVIVDGGGNDIILGNAGNDVLVGRKGNDILIGGIGRDVLVGAGGEDLLIGGSTTYDTNAAMLKQIQTAWISTAPFATRVANLRAGAGGVPKLDATTVLDDGVRDTLVGGPGLDWFFATGADHVAGKKKAGALN